MRGIAFTITPLVVVGVLVAACGDPSAPRATIGACISSAFYADRVGGGTTGHREEDPEIFRLTENGSTRSLCPNETCRDALKCADYASDAAYAKTFAAMEALFRSGSDDCKSLLQPYLDDGTCVARTETEKTCGAGRATKCDADTYTPSGGYKCCYGFKCAVVDDENWYASGDPMRSACVACALGGAACSTTADCCSGVCSPSKVCESLSAGKPCASNRDCLSGNCTSGACSSVPPPAPAASPPSSSTSSGSSGPSEPSSGGCSGGCKSNSDCHDSCLRCVLATCSCVRKSTC